MTARKIKITATLIITVATLITLQGCGSSGGGGTSITPSPTVAPNNLTISADNDTHLIIEWDFVRSADHFHVHEDRAGTTNYVQIEQSTDVYALSSTFNIPVHKLNWGTTQYGVEACDLNDTTRLMSDPITLPSALSPAAIGYFKASNTGANDWFGWSVALSGDGLTRAVGAKQEDGSTAGINGSDNNSSNEAGAVYVFRLTGTTWAQEAYVKPFNVGGGDQFGKAVALSADGNTLAVGANFEDSDTMGINGPDNDSSSYTGAVYVFTRSGTTWSQQEYIKASDVDNNDQFS